MFCLSVIYFGGYTVEEEPKQVLNSLMEAGIATVERFIHVDVHTGKSLNFTL